MGNQQGNVFPGTCVPGRQQRLLSQGSAYRHLSIAESESGSIGSNDDAGTEDDDELFNDSISDAAELENIIISDDTGQLEQICINQRIDINLQLNEKAETALILAVKLSHVEMVKTLLSTINIAKNRVNIQNFSALDIALISAFDNRLEPRQTICWQIIESLLQVDAEPSNSDAMMYVIRTALKMADEDFIYRLILLAQEFSNSVLLHELLLRKLIRYQPMYMESLDPIIMTVSAFTMKLLKNANGITIGHVVNSMQYYLELYWHSRTNKNTTLKKLIVYATGAGWDWTNQDMVHIDRVCPSLGVWCKAQRNCTFSLQHVSRRSFRRNVQCLVQKGILQLPNKLPQAIQDYLLLGDIDDIVKEDNLLIADVVL